MSREIVLAVEGVTKVYRSTEVPVYALRAVNCAFEQGEICAICGRSGAGKSSLLQLLGGLDHPDEGRVLLDGVDLARLSEARLAQLRGQALGFIFQSFNLIGEMTALQNIRLPFDIRRQPYDRAREREYLELLGLSERARHYPSELSGGEQQRVAICRALMNQPRVLLADEPTGNLDQANGETILGLLEELRARYGLTIIIVTHDMGIARRCDRIVTLADGRIVGDERRPSDSARMALQGRGARR